MAVDGNPSNYEGIKIAIQIIGYVVGWLVVVFGWIVTSKQSLNREKRKELRSKIDGIIDTIQEIEQAAMAFYRSTPIPDAKFDEHATKFWITNSLGRLSKVLSRIKSTHLLNCSTEMMRLRQSITSGDFADPKRIPRLDTDQLFIKIASSTVELIDKLESEYLRFHP